MDMSAAIQAIRARLSTHAGAAVYDTIAARLDDIAVELTRLYQDKIPVYRRFDPAVIEQNTRFFLYLVADQIQNDSTHLTTAGLVEATRMMSDQGTPLEPLAHSIQLGARMIVGIMYEHALELGLPLADIAAIQDMAWAWATEAAGVVQAVQREIAIADATRRADFLRMLVTGTLPPARFDAEAATLGIEAHHRYRIACTQAENTTTGSDVLTALRVHAATTDLPVVDAVVDDMLIALLPRRPDRQQWPRPIGIGAAVEPAQGRLSYEQARRAWEIADRHHIQGLVDLAALGPLPLLDQAADAAPALEHRHLAPLRAHGPSGQEIASTVSTYLSLRRRVDDTAATLHVHRNTVRYRLTRFTEITGLDLDDTEDLVLAWWLLNRPHPAPGPAASNHDGTDL